MKANKKVILTTATVLGAAALVAGGTIAYFTDTATETNHFTVGDVDITLYESQLHRQNSGRMGDFPGLASDPDYCDWIAAANVTTTAGNSSLISGGGYEKARYCTPHMNEVAYADDITSIENGHTAANRTWGYSDATIEADAETYKDSVAAGDTEDGYFTRVSQNIVPGQWIRKFAYVKNEDQSSDAYVLIRYMVPTEYADKVDVKIGGTPYEEDVSDADGHQGYFTALTFNTTTGKYEAFDASAADAMDNYTGYIQEIDNVEYRVYAAITTDALKPGEMTYWSPVNTVRLKTTVTTNDFSWGDAVDVKVDAQAVQAKTFANAVEAINAVQN